MGGPMTTNAIHPAPRWLVWGAALLPLVLCLGYAALSGATQDLLSDVEQSAIKLAGICVEWGTNWAGRPQVGLWWVSSHVNVVRPRLPPTSSLHVHCGAIPWSPHLPTRRTFIYTW